MAVMDRYGKPELGFRSCLGVLRLAGRHDPDRFDAAWRYALELGTATYRGLDAILRTGADLVDADPTLADTILDRLVHAAYRIELTGPSMRAGRRRMKNTRGRRRAPGSVAPLRKIDWKVPPGHRHGARAAPTREGHASRAPCPRRLRQTARRTIAVQHREGRIPNRRSGVAALRAAATTGIRWLSRLRLAGYFR